MDPAGTFYVYKSRAQVVAWRTASMGDRTGSNQVAIRYTRREFSAGQQGGSVGTPSKRRQNRGGNIRMKGSGVPLIGPDGRSFISWAWIIYVDLNMNTRSFTLGAEVSLSTIQRGFPRKIVKALAPWNRAPWPRGVKAGESL